MLLAIDIGNTNVTLGVFQGEALRATWRINTDIEKPVDEYAVLVLNLLRMAEVAPGEVTKAVQASVRRRSAVGICLEATTKLKAIPR